MMGGQPSVLPHVALLLLPLLLGKPVSPSRPKALGSGNCTGLANHGGMYVEVTSCPDSVGM